MFLKVVEYWFTACGFCFGLVCFSFFYCVKQLEFYMLAWLLEEMREASKTS